MADSPDRPIDAFPFVSPLLVDSHCHLAGDEYVNDLDAVIARAHAAGVRQALVVLDAGSVDEAARVPRLRELWPLLRFSAGIHPHRAGDYAADLGRVPSLVAAALDAHDAVRALGEIGLDYHYDFAPRAVQQEVFRLQVELARARHVPVIVHTREADADTLRILRDAGGGVVRGVFHCFTGDEALARGALDLGFFVSFSGIATFPRAEALRQIARFVPADRRLVETDSPYLAPPPYRGKRNEPAWVVRVAEILSEAVGEPLTTFAASTTKNFVTLFEGVTAR